MKNENLYWSTVVAVECFGSRQVQPTYTYLLTNVRKHLRPRTGKDKSHRNKAGCNSRFTNLPFEIILSTW